MVIIPALHQSDYWIPDSASAKTVQNSSNNCTVLSVMVNNL